MVSNLNLMLFYIFRCDLCTDGVPQVQNLKEEADLLVRVIATNCVSIMYDYFSCVDISYIKKKVVGRSNLLLFFRY